MSRDPSNMIAYTSCRPLLHPCSLTDSLTHSPITQSSMYSFSISAIQLLGRSFVRSYVILQLYIHVHVYTFKVSINLYVNMLEHEHTF